VAAMRGFQVYQWFIIPLEYIEHRDTKGMLVNFFGCKSNFPSIHSVANPSFSGFLLVNLYHETRKMMDLRHCEADGKRWYRKMPNIGQKMTFLNLHNLANSNRHKSSDGSFERAQKSLKD
jgi:hypothetical protein